MLPVLVVSDALGEHFSPPWNSAFSRRTKGHDGDFE